MTKLAYCFTNDVLFKMFFTQRQDLLKRLVASLLSVPLESIQKLTVTNPEILPDLVMNKLCRLDINMKIDDRITDLEVQVKNEGDYPERSLYYWARDFSSGLKQGMTYSELPQTIILNILDFSLFSCQDFHSEFRPLEVTRHDLLTDRMVLHYFELPKLPEELDTSNEQRLWLSLFKAKTIEELEQIKNTGGSMVQDAIQTYNQLSADDKFREMERTKHFAETNWQSSMVSAEKRGYQMAEEKYQSRIAELEAQIAQLKKNQ